MSFSLSQGVEVEFSPCNDAAPASFVCHSHGMGIVSQGFVDCASATIGTLGSQHVLWDTSDYLRFNQASLALESFSLAVPESTDTPFIEDVDTDSTVYKTRLVRPCHPFTIPSRSPTLSIAGDTLCSLYESCVEVKSIRRIAPNLALMFDVNGRICGWRMSRYLDQFRSEEKEVSNPAGDANYLLFKRYFNTFAAARFDADDEEIALSCDVFVKVIEHEHDGLRALALAAWVRNIADRHAI